MKLLIFDTETTGLPKSKTGAEKGPGNWPHMVSISWIILDTDTNTEIKWRNYLIKPNGWVIPDEAAAIHGISTELAYQKGQDLGAVMFEFVNEECDAWVAHNLEFDIGVVVNAVLWDLRLQFPAIPQRKFCTMNLSKPLCKLPGYYKNSYKAPKLKELYYAAFGAYPDERMLHSSMYDVEVLTSVIKGYLPLRQAMGLVARSVIQEDGRTLRICLKHADKEYESDTDMGK